MKNTEEIKKIPTWHFMDFDKAYDKVNKKAMWQLLQIYEVDGKLLRAVKSFYM